MKFSCNLLSHTRMDRLICLSKHRVNKKVDTRLWINERPKMARAFFSISGCLYQPSFIQCMMQHTHNKLTTTDPSHITRKLTKGYGVYTMLQLDH